MMVSAIRNQTAGDAVVSAERLILGGWLVLVWIVGSETEARLIAHDPGAASVLLSQAGLVVLGLAIASGTRTRRGAGLVGVAAGLLCVMALVGAAALAPEPRVVGDEVPLSRSVELSAVAALVGVAGVLLVSALLATGARGLRAALGGGRASSLRPTATTIAGVLTAAAVRVFTDSPLAGVALAAVFAMSLLRTIREPQR